MTALLTDNLPLLAGAPNGIKELRELILELAVRGKLVPQDPSDEPASELLKRIAAEKARLVAEAKIKKQKPLGEIGEEEKPFELPVGWEWGRLGELGLVGSSSRVHQKDWRSSGVPFYRAREIVRLSKEGSVGNDIFISEALFEELSGKGLVPAVGDIMITGVGTIGIPYRVRTGDRFYFKDASVLIFKGYAADCADYLLKYLVSPFWVTTIHEESMGATVHTLTIARASETLCPLPPIAEQQRIVAKVDELMALCDRLEARQADAACAHARLVQALLDSLAQAGDAADFAASWQRLAEHFHSLFTSESSTDALKQTLLQLAVMGKLVPQDPNDEPATVLIERIQAEKQRLAAVGTLRKQRQPVEIDESQKPYQLPLGWAWVFWDAIALKIGDIDHKMPETTVEGVPFVSPRDFYPGNIIDFDGAKRVSVEDFERLSAKIKAERGDLIYPRYGTIGENIFVDVDRDFLVSYSCAVIKVAHGYISPMYQFYVSLSACIRKQAKAAENKTTQANVGIKSIQQYLFPVPPLAEQHRIVAKLDQLLALCDQLKTRLTQARQLNEQLACTLVEQAVA